MNSQEAGLFFRLRVVPCLPVSPNNEMHLTRSAMARRRGPRR